ncbi:hypothetical protein [Nostoc sp. XA010]|nr:hypothetical protein [Nostoc sp. XA010]
MNHHTTVKSTQKAVWRTVALWRGGVAIICGMLCPASATAAPQHK